MIQHWRTMTVDLVFRTNNDIEPSAYGKLIDSVQALENTIRHAFPHSNLPNGGYILGHDEHLSLLNILKCARSLSYNLQYGIVTCRLRVTVAPSAGSGDGICGTYAFGLERITRLKTTVLVGVRALSQKNLQELL